MSGVQNWNDSVNRIAIVRALPGLGDFLCAVPAWRALRAAYPTARISLIGLPSSRALVDRFSAYIDELIELPGYPGLPEQPPQPDRLPDFFAEMRSRTFDLAVQMHGSGIVTNRLTLELGAARTIGFCVPGQACPDSALFLPYLDAEHEIRRYLRLLTSVGIPAESEALEFAIAPSDYQELQTLVKLHRLEPRRYVCLHAGASVPSRCWAGDRFAAVGDELARSGWQVVLTGSIAERGLADAIAQTMQAPAINLAGRTSLGTLAALLSEARLLVANDTGVSHLAAAVEVASVVIFSASDPQRWAPLNQQRHRAIVAPATVGAVLSQAQALLRESAYVA